MGFHGSCWLIFYCFVLKPHDCCKLNLPKPSDVSRWNLPVQEPPPAEVSQVTLQSYVSSNSHPSRGSLQSQQSVATVQSMDSLHEARRRSMVYRNQNVETFLKVRRRFFWKATQTLKVAIGIRKKQPNEWVFFPISLYRYKDGLARWIVMKFESFWEPWTSTRSIGHEPPRSGVGRSCSWVDGRFLLQPLDVFFTQLAGEWIQEHQQAQEISTTLVQLQQWDDLPHSSGISRWGQTSDVAWDKRSMDRGHRDMKHDMKGPTTYSLEIWHNHEKWPIRGWFTQKKLSLSFMFHSYAPLSSMFITTGCALCCIQTNLRWIPHVNHWTG